jgi:hypothetical protein
MPAHFRTSLDAAASLLVLPCGVALAAEPLIRLIVRGDDVGSSQASPRPRHARDAGGGGTWLRERGGGPAGRDRRLDEPGREIVRRRGIELIGYTDLGRKP